MQSFNPLRTVINTWQQTSTHCKHKYWFNTVECSINKCVQKLLLRTIKNTFNMIQIMFNLKGAYLWFGRCFIYFIFVCFVVFSVRSNPYMLDYISQKLPFFIKLRYFPSEQFIRGFFYIHKAIFLKPNKNTKCFNVKCLNLINYIRIIN